jgi:NAD(P)-dependent dehydrogenase (short-subunit alcohol dehydrogenase family)
MIRKPILATAAGILMGSALVSKAFRRRRAIDIKGRVVVITGGSRGLGLLIARQLGQLGARVILVARDQAELERAHDDLASNLVEASVVVADVGAPLEAQRIVADVVERHGRLDLLINNAGVITVGPQEHMTVADYQEAMATHFWGPLHTMRAAIPHMRQAGGGRIVNISSIGGMVGVPHLAPYCASKFALTGLSTAFRAELARDGILVTTVNPGLMRTGSPFNAWFKGRHRDEFTWFAISGSLPILSMDGRRAAAKIVDAAIHGDAELIITWAAKFAIAATGVMPNTVASVMACANRVLPSSTDETGDQRHSGWPSVSEWAPSKLTRLSERSAAENNELPQPLATPSR